MGRDAGRFSGDEGGGAMPEREDVRAGRRPDGELPERESARSGRERSKGEPHEHESARAGSNRDLALEPPGAERESDASESDRTLAGRHRVPLWILLFALFGGALAWTAHLLVSYFLVALGCNLGWGDGLFRAVLGATTVVFAGLAAAAALVAYRRWSGPRHAAGPDEGGRPDQAGHADARGHGAGGSRGFWELDEGLSRNGSLAGVILLMGLMLDALFGATIVLAGLPPFFLPACAEVVGG